MSVNERDFSFGEGKPEVLAPAGLWFGKCNLDRSGRKRDGILFTAVHFNGCSVIDAPGM